MKNPAASEAASLLAKIMTEKRRAANRRNGLQPVKPGNRPRGRPSGQKAPRAECPKCHRRISLLNQVHSECIIAQKETKMAVLSKRERRKEMASKHAKRSHVCQFCGFVAYGNGGFSSHMRKEYFREMPDLKGVKWITVKELRKAFLERNFH